MAAWWQNGLLPGGNSRNSDKNGLKYVCFYVWLKVVSSNRLTLFYISLANLESDPFESELFDFFLSGNLTIIAPPGALASLMFIHPQLYSHPSHPPHPPSPFHPPTTSSIYKACRWWHPAWQCTQIAETCLGVIKLYNKRGERTKQWA